MEKHRKTIRKPKEHQRKTIGKPHENQRSTTRKPQENNKKTPRKQKRPRRKYSKKPASKGTTSKTSNNGKTVNPRSQKKTKDNQVSEVKT